MESKPEDEKPSILQLRWILLGAVVAPLGLTLLLFLYVIPDPKLPDDPLERSQVLIESGAHLLAARALQPHLKERVFDVKFNRAFLKAHFMVPEYMGQGRKVREDRPVLLHYDNLCRSSDPRTKAFGCYYYGLYFAHQDENDRAMRIYDQIEDGVVPYLDFSRAMVYAKRGNHRKAASHLRREIDSGADRKIIVAALSNSLAESKEWPALRELQEDPNLGEFVSLSARQTYRLVHGDLTGYAAGYLDLYAEIMLVPLLLAVVGLAIWLWLLRWWTTMHPWQWPIILAVLLAGAVSAHLVYLAHDAVGLVFDLGFRGDYIKDFLFAILFIGIVEEFVKFVPVVLLSAVSNTLKKPVDWMVFAGISGLGFGAAEAYGYLSHFGHSIAVGRVFISLPLHVMLSAGIGIMVGEAERRGKSRAQLFAWGLALAAFVHGVFDYLLLGPFPLLGAFAFYVIIFVTLVFMQGRDGCLVLSGYSIDPESDFKGVKIQTAWAFAGFAILNVVTVVLAGIRMPDSELLLTTLMHGLFCLGPIFTVFLLSNRPFPVEWFPRWYRLNREPAELSPEQARDYRTDDASLESEVSTGQIVGALVLIGFILSVSIIMVLLALNPSASIEPDSGRKLMYPFAGLMFLFSVTSLVDLVRSVKRVNIQGDHVKVKGWLGSFQFNRRELQVVRAKSNGIMFRLKDGQRLWFNTGLGGFGLVMDELLPPLSEVGYSVGRKIVVMRTNPQIWEAPGDVEEKEN